MKVTFPHMGDYHICFKTLFKHLGCEVVVPPQINKRTIELGCKYSPEFTCFPFKLTLGSLIEGLEGGADTLFQGGRKGPCRYGYYKEVQEAILKDLGYEFKFLKLNGLKSIKLVNKNATKLQILKTLMLTLAKINAIEKFEKLVHKLGAYEANLGENRRVYKEFLSSCDEAESVAAVKRVEKEFLERFKCIKKIPHLKPLKVGIVGEFYVVMEPHSNLNIERELNQMRIEVVRPTFLTHVLRGALRWSPEKALFRRIARPYLQYECGAHANVSVAETITFAKEGLDGVIHLKPHACLPEVTAMSALYRISKDYNIPVLFFSFDEHTSSVGVKTRLEAFVELLKRRRKKKCISG